MKDSKREMMIIFVYDVGYCKKEADDPMNAILYFYPKWVSDYQKLLLCGQLMGTVQILNDTFDEGAKIISLKNGKFSVHKFDRFVIVIGSDRNIPETMLNYRTELISSLLNTFYNGIESVVKMAKANNTALTEILFNIFEEYLPIVQRNCNVFKSTPRLKLPKSASNVYLEANQLLQSILLVNGVLGGVIIYKNKVLTNQLPPSLTKILLLANVKSRWFCEMIKNISYHIPFGCNLKNLYIPTTDYKILEDNVTEMRTIFKNLNLKDTLLQFQIKKKSFTRESTSMIRREKSLAFANIPEEGEDASNMEISNGLPKRPTNLSLKLKSNASKDILKAKKNNIKFDEFDSFPNFIGKTSVILTPMAENKIFSHKDMISICAKTKTIPEAEEPIESKSDKNVGFVNKMIHSISLSNLSEKLGGNKLYRTLSDPTLTASDDKNSVISSKLYNEFLNSENVVQKNGGGKSIIKNIDVKSNAEKRKAFDKKSLTLSLKKNNFDSNNQNNVLTPLMSKLTDFSIKEKKISTKEQNNWPKLINKDSSRSGDEYGDVNSNNERIKCELFVCEQGNMSLMIVLEEGSHEKQQIIQDLFDTCISRISKIETNLMQALNIQVEAADKSNDKNGLICLDKEWDIVEECGIWSALPNTLELVHSVFKINRMPNTANFESLTDIILKTNDHVLYGNCTGENEVYYNHAQVSSQSGLPPPQDILAKIAFNAKRKLERDHSQILF